MENDKNAVEIRNLTVKYDGFTLDDVSFDVKRGSIMGFIGQNGAGKSTTIKAILGVIKQDAGTIQMLGLDSREHELELKQEIAAVFDEIPFSEQLCAANLDHIMKEIYREWDSAVFKQYLERLALPQRKKISSFSKGMKMKLQLAVALSHNAKLLILDEPTTGLDPIVRNECLEMFLEYRKDKNHTIFLSSHITTDLEKIADSVTFIHKGKLLLTGNKEEIVKGHGLIRCSQSVYEQMSPEDIVSCRRMDGETEIMVKNKEVFEKKYPGLPVSDTTLEEMMCYYVNAAKKEWS